MTTPLSAAQMDLLSRLVLPLSQTPRDLRELATDPTLGLDSMTREEFDALEALARSNHVIIRAFRVLAALWGEGGDTLRKPWADAALAREEARIRLALPFLGRICRSFQREGHSITVIKSLDHWPDLGSDLDLYSSEEPKTVLTTMQTHFGAKLADRSWGDKLAQKWNFIVPGLPELVEFHIGKLGQTGEQTRMAARLPSRARTITVEGIRLPACSASDRLMISTLQRMYRHFYFRLCDIIDSAELVQFGQVDFSDLKQAATDYGIWPGVATYLAIVSDSIVRYGSKPLELPADVRRAARFGGDAVYVGREFLRVPILPQSAKLYGRQLVRLIGRGSLRNGARLSLLPGLAVAAVIEQKRTGSDKGIW